MTEREAFEKWATETVAKDLDARAFEYPAWEAWQASRQQALEEAATVVEALRDGHCASTQRGDDPEFHCYADSPECEFVVAWNDAAIAIRQLSHPTGGKE